MVSDGAYDSSYDGSDSQGADTSYQDDSYGGNDYATSMSFFMFWVLTKAFLIGAWAQLEWLGCS